jgi:hypothetical protein
MVDGRRGTPLPCTVEVNPNGLYAWIADVSGLYYFNGAYSQIPVSFRQSDIWSQIAFPTEQSLANQFVIKDDPVGHRVMVLANVNGTTKLLVWDYTNGISPDAVRFTMQDPPLCDSAPGTNVMTAMEIVQNDKTAASSGYELWFGLAANGSGNTSQAYFAREHSILDANPYRDDYTGSNAAIHSIYETNVLPEVGGLPSILAHQAMFPRITGNGTITPTLYSLDKQQSKAFPALVLGTSPDLRFIQRAYLKSNGFIYHFELNAVDSYFILSDVTGYYSLFASHR